MKILIGGGGTGGHIYPALALARHAQAEHGVMDILFVGSAAGLENTIVPASGFKLTTIPASGLKRNLKQLGVFIKDLWQGVRRSLKIIKDYQPSVILGTGGYVAAPLVLSAILKRKPVVLHEQNAIPGMVNRLFAPFASRVCLSFSETAKKLPPFSKPVITGNPRASEVSVLSREEGCEYFGFDQREKTILVYSGSRGALKINQVMTAYLKQDLLPEKVNLIYVTGDIYYAEVKANIRTVSDRIRLYSYLAEMPKALAAADLAITRSGATTLAEITALGIPAVLIPSPNVVNNHQYHNARILSDRGAAVLIEEESFDHLRLQQEVNRLLYAPVLLEEMSKSSKKLGVVDAAEKLYGCLQEVAL